MDIVSFRQVFSNLPQIQQAAQQLSAEKSKIYWKGVNQSARSILITKLAEELPGNQLFVLSDKETAAYFLNDLEALYPEDKRIVFFPESYKTPYQTENVDNANVVLRAETLEKISQGKNAWIVSYPKALVEKVPTKQRLIENTLRVEVAKTYSIDFIRELLLEYHFEYVDFVYEPGQFAIRGGIVDVFSFAYEEPFRIEFFGDEVDAIRTFNPVDQLSIATHQFFNIVPNVQGSLLNQGHANLFEFIGLDSIVWLEDYDKTNDLIEKEFFKATAIFEKLDKTVRKTPPIERYLNPIEFSKAIERLRVIEFGISPFFKADFELEFKIVPQPKFQKNFELVKKYLQENTKQGVKNFIFSNNPKQIERLYAIFHDLGGDVEFTPMNFSLHEGFEFPALKIACLTDHELFERYNRFRLKEGFAQNKQALTLKEIYNLQKGDFVVHIDHGVGQFSGLETIDTNGKQQEAIRLVYKDNDVIYVSIHSLHRISKFSGKEGVVPKLNKIGTQAWASLKNKTKAKIKEIAFDLIQLYAKRKTQPGFAFTPDGYLQNELEASFMYEDTPDQLKATQAVKEDMESETPMDRLICGDVGFGKTEVAIRAAFKAACDGKQVAVLVPTTILSLQHYRSFKSRLKEFPVTVDYVNRFRSTKANSETIKKVNEGKVDILIGTHKLVNDKIKFKDLGLLIIDEEQKFGVSIKDKLKTLRETVDTLTLTATPIPRTLQFSLMGARDLSIISTPPPNRQPVNTEIIQFNEEDIRDAIAYEVSRNGQVYFVHNRVQNIREVAGMIQRLCPGVRVGIGHGQMEGKDLERIMMDFIDGEYDVLLATTIIEAGIDIPNANTIIINNAQNFGLSDLHQLRGRVGRSNRKAFCYLIAPKTHEMTSEARKRLEALVQFSDLGAGFNIAMKDLDIRGAGNLLGGEQSGFITDIGFEMYQKILNEAIDELRHNEFKELYSERNTDSFQNFVKECTIETDMEIRIPTTYVNNVNERLSLYQQLDNLKSEAELEVYRKELIDRFGETPMQVEELFKSFQLRWLAESLAIEKITIKMSKMICTFVDNPQSKFYDTDQFQYILNYVMTNPNSCKISDKEGKLKITFSNITSISKAREQLESLKVIPN
jgi:transcription-repair coupling factor (superfamily II helicase)